MTPEACRHAADQRFVAEQLTRYGTARAAREQVRRLRNMAPDGQSWYTYIEGLLACVMVDPERDPRRPRVTIVEP